MTVVLWARHGQNEANLTRTLSYRTYDRDLTQGGWRQAHELAESLAAAHSVGLIACSPTLRARHTADVVSERLGVLVSPVLDELREVDVGGLDGRGDEEAWRVYDEVLAAWRSGDASSRFPDGEDRNELVARVRRALTVVATQAAGRTALIVAHGAAIRAALPTIARVPVPAADLATGRCARLRVDVVDGEMRSVDLMSWPS